MSEKISSARLAAAYVLGRCRRFDAWSSQTIDAAVKKYELNEKDAALCNRICRCVLQNASLCDYYISCYSKNGLRHIEPCVLDILRIAICQILFMDKIPDSAASNEAVNMTKKTSPHAVGFVNAVLRKIVLEKDHLPEVPGKGTADYLAVQYSHPLWFCQKIMDSYGYEFTEGFLSANNSEPPLTVTTNPLKGAEEVASVDLDQKGDISKIDGFAEGRFFVQDGGAASSIMSLSPKSGARVLDGCAAPGGKSFLSAILMHNDGEIVSCDIHSNKLKKIEDTAGRLGITIIKTEMMDSSKPKTAYYDSFDYVIADVPCSGLGVIRRKPEIRYKKPEDISQLPEIQFNILSALSKCVKNNGLLQYSTCTILPEENTEVVSRFLTVNPNFRLEQEQTFWPHLHNKDGFYYCRMRRYD